MSLQRLEELDHILAGAGSDSARISLSPPDAKLLGLHNSTETVEEEFRETRDDGKGGMQSRVSTRKVKAVEAISIAENPAHAYDVNVGTARKALLKVLNGRSVGGRRQPDVPPAPPANDVPPEPEEE